MCIIYSDCCGSKRVYNDTSTQVQSRSLDYLSDAQENRPFKAQAAKDDSVLNQSSNVFISGRSFLTFLRSTSNPSVTNH